MKHKPLVSIITTVRNGEDFIFETLKSVREQTFRPIEHIIIDDGSIDNTISVIENFRKHKLDYDLLLFQPKLFDRGKSLNYAVSKAQADWIAIIDADDLWHPQKLTIQYNLISHHNIDVLATDIDIIQKMKHFIYKDVNPMDKKDVLFLSVNNMLKSNRIPHSSVLIKTDLCKYDENRKSQYDFELWLRLLFEKKILAILNEKLCYRRIHQGQFFESKMGKTYRLRSFMLKAQFLFKFKNKIKINMFLYLLIYIFIKFCFDMFFHRKIRFIIRDKVLNFKKQQLL